MGTIELYHGSRKWEGPPEVRPGKKGRSENGPGIYMTTSLATARSYAKGGGRVIRFVINADMRLIGMDRELKINIDDALEFLKTIPRLKKRKEIVGELKRFSEQIGQRDVFAQLLGNLMVNRDALTGDVAPAVAKFYVSQGIDGEVMSRGDEEWLVLYNPEKIVSFSFVNNKDPYVDLPLIRR